jgi:predicted MFS family arabinose efflux permease
VSHPVQSFNARIFLCFAYAYFLSYALRSVNAAIAPGLVQDLSLNAEQLGKLTSAYLLAFASLQIPLGLWLDRYGARKTESALLIVAAIGALVFSMAQSYWGLWIGRALIGAGVCACLMAAFKGFREWFEPHMQSRLAAWMLVAGTSGVLTTTVPVQWLVAQIGWRPVFIIFAVLLLLSSLALWFGLPKTVNQASPQGEQSLGYRDVIREPYFWRMSLLGIVFVGGFVALQSLWIGPWMTAVLGMTPQGAAEKLFLFNVVLMLAYLGLGSLLPKMEAKGASIASLAIGFNTIGLVALALIAVFVNPTSWLIWLVVAITTTVNTLVQPHVSMYFPKSLAGRANAFFNLLIFAGAFLLQWGFGALVEVFKSGGTAQVQAYQNSLLVYVGLGVVTLVVFIVWRPKPPEFANT